MTARLLPQPFPLLATAPVRPRDCLSPKAQSAYPSDTLSRYRASGLASARAASPPAGPHPAADALPSATPSIPPVGLPTGVWSGAGSNTHRLQQAKQHNTKGQQNIIMRFRQCVSNRCHLFPLIGPATGDKGSHPSRVHWRHATESQCKILSEAKCKVLLHLIPAPGMLPPEPPPKPTSLCPYQSNT
jgi:hypothetical protein